MPLARLDVPFDHPDWIFELKWDGFRALAHVDRSGCRLMSRNRNPFKTFPRLAAGIAEKLGRSAVIDGEIVCLGPDGKPRFYDLMRRRSPQYFYAFDLLSLDGRDLRHRPLVERKAMLREVVRLPMIYVDHVREKGTGLFKAVCEQDLEGIVAKLAAGLYTPEATTWVKVRNKAYSQAQGRGDFFEVGRTART